ncbi:MAG: MMPL family transporter [Spirochaetaceae bacterium]|nr:MMPL family transporter [Spirochaetaceae bacterium]
MEKLFKHPWVIVGVIAVLTVFFALQLPKARMDNNINAMLPDDNPARVIAKHLEAEYGDNLMLLIGLERPYGTVFDGEFLSRIREFTDAVEEIELVKDTNSLMSTMYITSDSESIIVTDLVGDDFSGTPEEIAELKHRIASWDMYQGSLVSEDLSATQVMITINASGDESGEPEVVAVLRQVRDMAKEMFAGAATVYPGGQPVVTATMTEASMTDMRVLLPLVIVVLLGVLVISLRRFSYVALPILTVIIATIWAIGAMPFLGIHLTMLCMILPIILIAVGSAYGIHIISHYKDEVDNKTFTICEHRAHLLALVSKLLKPVALAALTTFAGFISFALAPLNAIRDFGIFAAFGVVTAFIIAITLIPAILLIRAPRSVRLAQQRAAKRKEREKKIYFDFGNGLSNILSVIAGKKTLVLVITVLVILVSIVGTTNVFVDNSMVEMFNDESEVKRSVNFIRDHFGGSAQLIMSVEADDTQTLLHPDVLNAIDGLAAHLLERVPTVTRVTGFTDTIKRMNQMFNVNESPEGLAVVTNYGDDEFGFGSFEDNVGGSIPPRSESFATQNVYTLPPSAGGKPPATPPSQADSPVLFAMLTTAAGKHATMSANELVRELERMSNYEGYAYYEIPAEPARYGKQTKEELAQLVANYLVLIGGQNDNSMSNDPLEPTAIETMILISSNWQHDAQNVMRQVNAYVAANFPKNVRVVVGGGPTQEGAISQLVTRSQISSMLMSIIIILLIVAISYKSIAAGLIATLPLVITILGNFAIMGFMQIPINMATALISSLTVGIGVDYTIHFIDAFKREYAAGGDYLNRTFYGAGKAILINALSVGLGISVLAISQIGIMRQLGGLIGISMGLTAVASLTVIPVLLATVKPKFIYGKKV